MAAITAFQPLSLPPRRYGWIRHFFATLLSPIAASHCDAADIFASLLILITPQSAGCRHFGFRDFHY
jgi:hypothetical protein